MMPRRSKKNSDLPDNLYQNGDYFRWKNPLTDKYKSLNCSRAEAIKAANIANNAVLSKVDLSQHLLGSDNTVSSVLDGFEREYIPIKKWRDGTIKDAGYRIKTYRKRFGHYPIQQITVLVLKDFLSEYGASSYIKHRQLWIDIFTYAISIGLTQFNCGEATLKISPPKRKTKRLTNESYKAVYDKADTWFKNVMELARISLQRRGDLCSLQYNDYKKDGYLYIKQSKSLGKETANLKILVWKELKQAIHATKTVPFSPYVLHRHSKRRANDKQKLDNSVKPDFVSKQFAKYAKLAKVENVTFREIRSYGARQYEEQGYSKSFIQALLGHADESMTDYYLDDGEIKWTEVKR